MGTSFQVVIDCADPDKLARFWVEALHYKIQDPPQGFASWIEFLKAQGVPESDWNSASAIVDPEGKGSRIYFQRVPETKTVKNRVHLDINVGGGREVSLEERRKRVSAEMIRLEGFGAKRFREMNERDEYWIVMQDPEGNEFCLQ
jgi:hypothetical protein